MHLVYFLSANIVETLCTTWNACTGLIHYTLSPTDIVPRIEDTFQHTLQHRESPKGCNELDPYTVLYPVDVPCVDKSENTLDNLEASRYSYCKQAT